MSSLFAITAIGLLHAAILLPLGAIALKPATTPVIATGFGLFVSLTAALQSGLFLHPPVNDLDVADAAAARASPEQCSEILTLLDRAGAIVDRRRPPRLVVSGERWSQLPEEAQQIVRDCVQASWGAGAPQAEVITAP